MQSEPSGGLVLPDEEVQVGVLRHLLDLHPAQLTDEELVREVVGDVDDFAERDAVRRAVGELVGSGLVHRHGRFVFPTRAALVFHALAPSQVRRGAVVRNARWLIGSRQPTPGASEKSLCSSPRELGEVASRLP